MLTTETNLGLMLTMLVREVAMIGKPVQPFGAMFYAGQLRGMYIMLNNMSSTLDTPFKFRLPGQKKFFLGKSPHFHINVTLSQYCCRGQK